MQFHLFSFVIHILNFFSQLPVHIKLTPPKESLVSEAAIRKRKGKSKEGENDIDMIDIQEGSASKNALATLDIFAGCGGLSEGLQKAGNYFWLFNSSYLCPLKLF